MKNLVLVLLGILLLFSCNPRAAKLRSRVNDTCHIEQYFHKFMSRFPNGTDNAIKL